VTPPAETSDRSDKYEHRDIQRRQGIMFAVAFVLTVTALIGVVSWWGEALWGFHAEPRAALVNWHTTEIPQPRLQIHPPDDLSKLRAAKEHRLGTTGWVDQTHGIAHIPIDRAMAIEAGRGAGGR
jgi:hypothetical protein